MISSEKSKKNKMVVSTIKLSKEERIKISNTKDLYTILLDILKREGNLNLDKEHFWFVGFDEENYILCIDTVALGGENMVGVNNIGTFRNAMWLKASYGIIAHNHPSGNFKPSEDDIDTTDLLNQIGIIAGVPLKDHLIITLNSYLSFLENGIMAEIFDSIKHIPNFMMKKLLEEEREKIIEEATKKGLEEGEQIGLKKGIKVGQKMGIERGKKLGKNLEKKEIAKKMKEKDIPIFDIMEITGLSEEDIQDI